MLKGISVFEQTLMNNECAKGCQDYSAFVCHVCITIY